LLLQILHLQIYILFLYDILMDIYTKIYCVHLIFILFGYVQILKLELTGFDKRRLVARNIVCGAEYGPLVQNMQVFDHDIRINGINK
jgi:hypothetical protein